MKYWPNQILLNIQAGFFRHRFFLSLILCAYVCVIGVHRTWGGNHFLQIFVGIPLLYRAGTQMRFRHIIQNPFIIFRDRFRRTQWAYTICATTCHSLKWMSLSLMAIQTVSMLKNLKESKNYVLLYELILMILNRYRIKLISINTFYLKTKLTGYRGLDAMHCFIMPSIHTTNNYCTTNWTHDSFLSIVCSWFLFVWDLSFWAITQNRRAYFCPYFC